MSFEIRTDAPAPSDADRLAPRRRPPGRNQGTQRWRDLLFLHWETDADALRHQLPPRLALDLLDGRALVGVVPFAMHGVRPAWLPRRAALDFLETNVRTYVVDRETGEPGVWFLSLEAASWPAVVAARTGWGLPYHHATMRYLRPADGPWHYGTVRRGDPAARLEVRFVPGSSLPTPEPGSDAFFLLERYLLFSAHGDRLMRGQVYHVPYPAQAVDAVRVYGEGLVAAAGLPPVEGPPRFAHFSRGVDVEVFGPHAIGV